MDGIVISPQPQLDAMEDYQKVGGVLESRDGSVNMKDVTIFCVVSASW